MVTTSFQSTKPTSSFKQSQKSRKLDFENVICVLDLEPEDSGYKLLSALINNGKLSIISAISLSKSELKEIRVVDNNETTLAFDDWEVAEIFTLCSYFMHKRSEHENFQLREIDPESFESFKLSPICDQITRTRRNMSRSTKGQPNLSRPSVSPVSISTTSSSSIETLPSISPLTEGEGSSLKCSSYSLNGEGNNSSSIEPQFCKISHISQIGLDLAFEDHVITEDHNLRDDSSYPSESPEPSSCHFDPHRPSFTSSSLDSFLTLKNHFKSTPSDFNSPSKSAFLTSDFTPSLNFTTADTRNLDIDLLSFEQHVLAASSDLESVNSEDYESDLKSVNSEDYKVEFSIAKDGELHMDVSCDTLEFTNYITTNRNNMSTSSFAEDLIVTSSYKLNAKSHEFSTLHNKYLATPPSPLRVHREIKDTSNIKQHEPFFITPSLCIYGNDNNSEAIHEKDHQDVLSASSSIHGETTHSSETVFEFDFDEEAFKSHLRNATSSLKDDFSCSTFETENSSNSSSLASISSIEPRYSSWFNGLLIRAYERLDKEIKEIRDNFFVSSHIEGRYQGKCARTSSTKGLHINVKPISNLNTSSPSSENDASSKSPSFKGPKVTPVKTSCTSSAHHEPHPLESSFISCISSSILSSTSPIENSKVNRSPSLSFTSSSSDSCLTSKNHFKSTSSVFNSPSESSLLTSDFTSSFNSLETLHIEKKSLKETSSHHSSKEIKGPDKTLHSLHYKIIFGKTSGFCKTFSLSHLGTSTCGKSKVKAINYLKSPSQTKPNRISSSTCCSRSSSETRNPTFLRLVNGEQPLYFISVVLEFTILPLAYLLLLKLLHLPFDRGKDSSIIPLL